jgi:hypothetical protein
VTNTETTPAEREYERRLRMSEHLGRMVSDRDMEEMDHARCAADMDEVGSL